MKIYSIQPLEVYKLLLHDKVLQAKPNFALDGLENCDFRRSYAWLTKQMIDKKVKGNIQIFPFWGWAYREDKARPDLRLERTHKPQVMLTLEIPDNEVLISDYDLWHCVLNNFYISVDNYNYDTNKSRNKQAGIEKSWNRIF